MWHGTTVQALTLGSGLALISDRVGECCSAGHMKGIDLKSLTQMNTTRRLSCIGDGDMGGTVSSFCLQFPFLQFHLLVAFLCFYRLLLFYSISHSLLACLCIENAGAVSIQAVHLPDSI
ncbi:hypothetical protein V8C35DRAFT_292144 [Trichoderma chlorosporum]